MLSEYQQELFDNGKKYFAERFKIPIEDIHWFNGGICYDRIVLKTKESADKVTACVKDNTVNGGYFDGMNKGGQSESKQEDGSIYYDVIC